jgi:hypothetical protein
VEARLHRADQIPCLFLVQAAISAATRLK